MRYQLIINGNVVKTEHLPFSISGEKGAYFPLVDVLAYFDIHIYNSRAATGRVNDLVFKVQASVPKMTIGQTILESSASPQYVDGCLYVPSFLFMELLDTTVNFSSDHSGGTLFTDH